MKLRQAELCDNYRPYLLSQGIKTELTRPDIFLSIESHDKVEVIHPDLMKGFAEIMKEKREAAEARRKRDKKCQ